MFSQKILSLAKEISCYALKLNLTIGSAESFTCGLVAAALTSIPGSSSFFDRAVIAYSREAKHELLGVPLELIKKHGTVSSETAIAMAEGLLSCNRVELAISTTGNAGPKTDGNHKPVGLTYFACASKRFGIFHQKKSFTQLNRQKVQMQSVEFALLMLKEILQQK